MRTKENRTISQLEIQNFIEGTQKKGGVNERPTTPPPPPPTGQGGKKKQSDVIQQIIRGNED